MERKTIIIEIKKLIDEQRISRGDYDTLYFGLQDLLRDLEDLE